MEFTFTFIQLFLWGIYLAAPLLLMLCSVFLLLGLIVGHLESWSKFDSLYWAFITAFTVGYGDIRPLRRRSKVLSIMIAGIGIMFTGLLVAITIETSSRAFNMHTDPAILLQIEKSLK